MRVARGADNIGQSRTESVPAHFARLHRPLNRLRIVCGAFLCASVGKVQISMERLTEALSVLSRRVVTETRRAVQRTDTAPPVRQQY